MYKLVSKIKVKIYEYKGRHNLNLKSDFVTDSRFPFKPNEELTARIVDNKILIEKPTRKGNSKK